MNDPHVKALYDRVVMGKNVDYDGAEPLQQITNDFDFCLDGNTAAFQLKKHYLHLRQAESPLVVRRSYVLRCSSALCHRSSRTERLR